MKVCDNDVVKENISNAQVKLRKIVVEICFLSVFSRLPTEETLFAIKIVFPTGSLAS